MFLCGRGTEGYDRTGRKPQGDAGAGLDVVSDHFNVSVSELKGSRRNARTAGARQIVMYLCRQMTDASLQSIGDLLGGRDHSTVNHGVDKIARDVEKDETLRNTIEIIQKKISPL